MIRLLLEMVALVSFLIAVGVYVVPIPPDTYELGKWETIILHLLIAIYLMLCSVAFGQTKKELE